MKKKNKNDERTKIKNNFKRKKLRNNEKYG